jgi:hypothetical protein
MTRIKIIPLALSTVFVVVALASATARASENPVLVTSTGAAFNGTVSAKSLTGTTLSGTGAGDAQIECATDSGSGTVVTTKTGEGRTSGTGTDTLTGCKTAAGKCQNTSKSGEITGTISVTLVWLGKESEKKPGILTSILTLSSSPGNGKGALLSFLCSSELVDNEGAFLASLSRELNEKFTTIGVTAKQSGGIQDDKEYTENGKTGTDTLFTSVNHGAFDASGREGEGEATYSESVEMTEN